MLVGIDLYGLAAPGAGHGDRDDLFGEEARCLRGLRALLAAQRERVLVLAVHAVVGGHVLAGLRHALGAVRRVEGRIDEAPAHGGVLELLPAPVRSEEHTSELQSLMRISYAVFCLKKKKNVHNRHKNKTQHNLYKL